MKKQTLAMVVAVALIAAAARSDITIHSGSMYDIRITNPTPVGANPGGEQLVEFMLKIVNMTGDPGFNPAGFDGSTPQESQPGNPGAWPGMETYFGFMGVFHNQYLEMIGTSPTLDDPDFATDIDTHFNLLTGDVLGIGAGPSETNAVVGPNTAEPFNATGPFVAFAATDFGDRLYGNFSVVGGAAADVDGDGDPTVWQLAYFAVPEDQLWGVFGWDFFVTSLNGGERLTFVPPEPATLSLLAIGGTALLRRRRRA